MKLNLLSSQMYSALTSPARRPGAEAMRRALAEKGVVLSDAEVAQVGDDLKRLNALHQLDFAGGKTAFEHIEAIASAQTLADGSPSAVLAKDLFLLAGSARSATFGKCYARTSHTVYSVHHAAEMNRILHGLGVEGAVTLSDGTTVKWDPASYPFPREETGEQTMHPADRLWSSLNHLLTAKELPENPTLNGTSDSAYRGQMANISTRLMGEQFVNVDGSAAMKHLTGIIDGYGPMFAEYNAHAGSVASVTAGMVESLEGGEVAPNNQEWRVLGYTVVPKAEAERVGLKAIEYPAEDDKGYATLVPPKKKKEEPT